MKISLTISVITVFMVIIFTAGCTGGGGQTTPAQTVPPTPLQTMAISTTAAQTSAGGSTQPGPTQTIPPNEAVSVSVEKAGTYSTTIIGHFDGGKGINFVSKIEVRVTRPDGSTEIKILQPEIGKEVEIEGTQGTDRVEVTAYMKSGKIYKIIDQQMLYKRRG
jgi:hypothetical protein